MFNLVSKGNVNYTMVKILVIKLAKIKKNIKHWFG